MSDVTRLLDSAAAGDRRAARDLLPLVYNELRAVAAMHLTGEKPGHSLGPTALVHEAFLRLAGGQEFESESHFLRVAAGVMRHILVDHARARTSAKRGGRRRRVPLGEGDRWTDSTEQLLDLDAALTRFAAAAPLKAELVVLRFFGGLSAPEAAAALDISPATATRWWTFARAWLIDDLTGENHDNP